MDSTANSNWMVQAQPWNGSASQIFGGGGDPSAVNLGTGASRLDKIRMGAGQMPDAQYPDGYLGNYQSKQAGKLKDRMGDRSYQRGVHKFVQMPPDEYRWPDDFNLESGLRNQAVTARPEGNVILCQRFSPTGDPVERYRQGGDVSNSEMSAIYRRYGINAVTGQATDTMDPARKAVIARMAPGLSW